MLDKLRAKAAAITARRAEGEKGFTLIELLVVVVIIGILVAIAIPLYLHFENGAKTSGAESDAHGLANTVKLCQSDNGGALPTAMTGGTTAGGTVTFTGTGTPNPCANDTFNMSNGDTAVYTVAAGTTGTGPTYTIAVSNADSGKTATYDSATGKTVTADS